jgi:hypothetical protein
MFWSTTEWLQLGDTVTIGEQDDHDLKREQEYVVIKEQL